MDRAMAEGRGAFLLGAHIGSFEALHAIGESRPGMQVSMVMFPDNARMIHSVLQALAPDFKLGIIAIGRPGSTLAIRDALNANGLVGLLGDRSVAPDGSRATAGAGALSIPFLGQPTVFSDGPLRLALVLKRKVIFMVGLYIGGRRYDLRFEDLADFSNPPADVHEREALMHQALRNYVARLEALVREAPYNWFNFFDYWNEDTPVPHG
jgi:predicted LPLAT superfamily acyltransferase